MTPERIAELRKKHCPAKTCGNWNKNWPREINECLDYIEKLMAVVEAANKLIELERYYYIEKNLPYPDVYINYYKALEGE